MGSPSQSLCLACGLCCDGTLFGWVELRSEDDARTAKESGLNVVPYRGRDVLTQPCLAHKNCACTVYANRPEICRAFRCKLLKKLEQGDISEEAAQKIVESTVTAKNETLALANGLSANVPAVWPLIAKLLENPNGRAAHVPLLFNFVILQNNLNRFFRKKPKFFSLDAPAA